MYVNEFDKDKSCAISGKDAEDLFERWLKKNNRKYRKATLEEQYQHIDFIVEHPETSEIITIDIKAPKKRNRNDKTTSGDIIWVEFVNVNGNKGWLYGNNKYTVFYVKDGHGFLSVETKELAELCEKLCVNGVTDKSSDALYKKYTRAGRKDVISMIQLSDILDCSSITFIKEV